jgi:hypothetical protein
VEDKFQDILNKMTKKSGRSRLEPYGDLIDELRGRGLRIGISQTSSLMN